VLFVPCGWRVWLRELVFSWICIKFAQSSRTTIAPVRMAV
jgi:hypothetical protein